MSVIGEKGRHERRPDSRKLWIPQHTVCVLSLRPTSLGTKAQELLNLCCALFYLIVPAVLGCALFCIVVPGVPLLLLPYNVKVSLSHSALTITMRQWHTSLQAHWCCK